MTTTKAPSLSEFPEEVQKQVRSILRRGLQNKRERLRREAEEAARQREAKSN